MSETRERKSRYVIYITGEVNDDTYNGVLDTINGYIEAPDEYDGITLIINSHGGEIRSGIAIYDFLKSLNTSIYTVALSECSSIASAIYALGEKRFVSEHTLFTLHSTSVSYGSQMTKTDMNKMFTRMQAHDKHFSQILKEASGVGANFKILIDHIFNTSSEEVIIAEGALAYGFATDKYENVTDII